MRLRPAAWGLHPAGGEFRVSALAIALGPTGEECGEGGGPQRPADVLGSGWVESKGP